jgi:hypothetical protein
MGELATFLATPLASWIIGTFVYWTVISLTVVYCGLSVFMIKFMTYTVHSARVGALTVLELTTAEPPLRARFTLVSLSLCE